jgi:hypothetical protein
VTQTNLSNGRPTRLPWAGTPWAGTPWAGFLGAGFLGAGLLLAVMVVGSPRARAQSSPAETRARVARALLAFEQSPPSFWEGLGPEGLAALVALVEDPRAPLAVRRRAVTVARHYRSPAARLFLRTVAAAPHEDELVSRYALLSLAEAFGGAVLGELAAAFRDSRAMVREGAAIALDGLRGARPAEVLAVLTAARASETERFVQVALDGAIARWSGASSPGQSSTQTSPSQRSGAGQAPPSQSGR